MIAYINIVECNQIAYYFPKEVKAMVCDAKDLPLILTTEHIQKLSGLSMPTIYKLLEKAEQTGMFSVRRAGVKWLISRDSFLAWLNGELEKHPETD